MNTYKVGNTTKQIELEVDIDTFGLAASRAVVLKPGIPSSIVSVAHSANATGDIKRVKIGAAKSLIDKKLSIITKIDLVGNDEDANKSECERLGGIYILDKGTGEEKTFDNPEKTIANDFTSVLLYLEVNLIK
jgi:hypothetical protein